MYKVLAITLCFVALAYTAIEVKFSHLDIKKIETSSKLWRHRGGEPENSIYGISKSLNDGYRGIEIDIHYNSEQNNFLVIHDLKESSNSSNTLTLNRVLSNFSTFDVRWWFDLKNLSNENHLKILDLLKNLEDVYDLKNKYFIESDQYTPLRVLSKSSIPSVYWINPHSKSRIFLLRKLENKIKLIFSSFIGVSIYHTSYDEKAKSYLSDINKFIFTVNGQEKEKYLSDPSVNVVLTDEIMKTETISD